MAKKTPVYNANVDLSSLPARLQHIRVLLSSADQLDQGMSGPLHEHAVQVQQKREGIFFAAAPGCWGIQRGVTLKVIWHVLLFIGLVGPSPVAWFIS
ncbi:hypothetical protein WJX82_010108 [Trebouxia sp. C0006]